MVDEAQMILNRNAVKSWSSPQEQLCRAHEYARLSSGTNKVVQLGRLLHKL